MRENSVESRKSRIPEIELFWFDRVKSEKNAKHVLVSGCDVQVVVVEGPWSTFEGLGGVTMAEEDKRAERLETCHSRLTNEH